MKNKDPLVILKHVVSMHSDEEVLRAMKNQNQEIFQGLSEEESNLEVKYRKKTRNPHVNHIVLRASPTLWKRLVKKGKIHIDIQRICVSDRSPLVQCSQRLGYGHTKRLCTEKDEISSHCAEYHKKSKVD